MEDGCIINNRHKCPLGLDVKEVKKDKPNKGLNKIPSKPDVKLLGGFSH